MVHDAGGQVYVDGANLNALLGYARFGDFGGEEGVAVLRGECLHHWFVGCVSLDERPARLFVTASTARDLADELECAFTGAEIAAL